MMTGWVSGLRKYMQSGFTEAMYRVRQRGEYRWSRFMGALITIIIVSGNAGLALAAEQRATAGRAAVTGAAELGIDAGRLRFEKNCAICHGLDARGNGPFAELLNVKPPDLTLLSRAEGGDFPFSRIYQRIDGRNLPLAHGTRAMPIWGQRLKREGGDETYVRGRMFEIMLYLESLQQI